MGLRHPVATLSLLVTVFGCASVTEYMPPGGSAADSARVVILRNRHYVGSFLPVGVMLDGWPIARLRIGQYIEFWVPPGPHSISEENQTEKWVPPGSHSVSTTRGFNVYLEFQQGESYYFVITANWALSGMEIEQWPGDRAQPLMAKYRRLEVE